MGRRLLLAVSVFVVAAAALAGGGLEPPPAAASEVSDPVVLVVDTSGSMRGTRLSQAKDALRASVGALDDDRPAGLRSYAGGCANGGILRVPVGVDNRDALLAETDALVASGGTPTPAALRAAADDLPDGTGTIVLISDGQSTCGDPCPVAQQLAEERGIDFTVHTVGFFAPDQAETELACIAEATGGTYVPADDADTLQRAINDALGARQQLGRFVVMGDSFSSGEGADNYDIFSGDCHRSPLSWGGEIDLITDAHLFANVACSGAELRHLTDTPFRKHGVDRTQIDQLGELTGADFPDAEQPVETVMFTIGGNDLGFAKALERCYRGGIGERRLRVPIDRSGRYPGSCLALPAFQDTGAAVDELFAEIADDLLPALRRAAPGARYVLVGYPRILPQRYEDATECSWLVPEAHEAISRVNTQMTLRGHVLADAEDDLLFVNSFGAHVGRELCTEDSVYVPVVSKRGPWDQQQGHPNATGQRLWADAILAELRRQGISP